MLSLIPGTRPKALEGEKEKLVSLEAVKEYLCHSNPKHVILLLNFVFHFLFYSIR